MVFFRKISPKNLVYYGMYFIVISINLQKGSLRKFPSSHMETKLEIHQRINDRCNVSVHIAKQETRFQRKVSMLLFSFCGVLYNVVAVVFVQLLSCKEKRYLKKSLWKGLT